MADEKNPNNDARREKILETTTAVLLGITTLLSAWATWVGSLHAGHEQIHLTESNNTASSAVALYNDATQSVVQDISIWSSIQNYYLDAQMAAKEGDDAKLQAANAKLEALNKLCTDELKTAIDWALKTGKSPFEMEGYSNSYYKEPAARLQESRDILEAGKKDNLNSHRFGLVSVIYALVLFLLGIAGTFKRSPNRLIIMGAAVALLAVGFFFMISIPLPEGFNLFHFLGME